MLFNEEYNDSNIERLSVKYDNSLTESYTDLVSDFLLEFNERLYQENYDYLLKNSYSIISESAHILNEGTNTYINENLKIFSDLINEWNKIFKKFKEAMDKIYAIDSSLLKQNKDIFMNNKSSFVFKVYNYNIPSNIPSSFKLKLVKKLDIPNKEYYYDAMRGKILDNTGAIAEKNYSKQCDLFFRGNSLEKVNKPFDNDLKKEITKVLNNGNNELKNIESDVSNITTYFENLIDVTSENIESLNKKELDNKEYLEESNKIYNALEHARNIANIYSYVISSKMNVIKERHIIYRNIFLRVINTK